MAEILTIDDEKLVCESISNLVRHMGHNPSSAQTLAEGLRMAETHPFDVVFLDVHMPDGSGLDLIPTLRRLPSSPEVIIITGFGDPDGAEIAIKNDAWDYIEKSSSVQGIRLPLLRAIEYRAEKKATKSVVAVRRQGIIGNNPKLNAALDVLAQAGVSDANVLVRGETGTGKELFAWAIHDNSSRSQKNFVVVDCAALPETLVESVLFGHRKGAFTGADRNQDGLVKQADRGTLFLDEIGELPLPIQKGFLRVLQERRFRPVGGDHEETSDFRLVAATNRDLEGMVKQGLFRDDLLFRIRTLVIDLPPLRECGEDLKELAYYHMDRLTQRLGIEPKGYSQEFWDMLYAYPWPGNTRELIQALEKSLLAANQDPVLFPKHLPSHIRIQISRNALQKSKATTGASIPGTPPAPMTVSLQEVRDTAIAEAENRYLKELLSFTRGDIGEACSISGLSRSRLYALLKRYRHPDKPENP